MTTKKKPTTDKEILELVVDLIGEDIALNDAGEADMLLREAGLDPDALAQHYEQVAQEAWAQSPLNWRNRDQLEKAKEHFANIQPKSTPTNRNEILEAIQALTNRLGQRGQPVLAAHRNFTEAPDEDLLSILHELEFLTSQQSDLADEDGDE
jgi:hypothetical protein